MKKLVSMFFGPYKGGPGRFSFVFNFFTPSHKKGAEGRLEEEIKKGTA